MKVSLHNGSSPHKASLLSRGDPRPGGQANPPAKPLGNTGMPPRCTAAPLGRSAETHQPTGVGRHLLSQLVSVPHIFLPFQTRPTWAYPAHYMLALAFSVIPMLRPLTRLAVRSARFASRDGADSVSMFCNVHRIDLGSLSTPAVLLFASGYVKEPELTACLLAQA